MTPTDATRATAEAMPEINRRRMLLGLTASAAAMAAVPVAAETKSALIDEIDESQELIDAWKQHRDAENEYHAAKEALGWLADEWKHLWPLAPEEILAGVVYSPGYYSEGIEKDIIGQPIKRDTQVLTTRLDKKFRAENDRVCFAVYSPDATANHLAEVRSRAPQGRTAKTRDKWRKSNERYIAKLEARLHLATDYHSETKRLREAAGVDAAKRRIKTAEDNIDAAAATVSKLPSRTLVGLRLKADILLYSLERLKLPRNDAFIFGSVWRLTEDVLDATQDLDGKRSAAPLLVVKGGAK